MPLLGEDPFGQRFLDLYDEWQDAGAPYHGLPVVRRDAAPQPALSGARALLPWPVVAACEKARMGRE